MARNIGYELNLGKLSEEEKQEIRLQGGRIPEVRTTDPDGTVLPAV